ncbi:MAG: hypothetical protein U0324_19880 [Polyangiales bacterium]
MDSRPMRALMATVTMLSLGACAPEETDEAAPDPDEITGQNAVGRMMTITGYVLVDPGASDATITDAVRRQTRTVFGPLRNLQASLDDREVATIDRATFVREPVTVVDTERAGAPTTQKLRVRYTYTGRGLVAKSMASRRSLSTTALFGNYFGYANDIISTCTDDPEAREFGADGLWYMFNPGVAGCARAINAEVAAIDNASRKLTDRRAQVSALELNRRYLPLTVKLATIRAPQTATYPEYDQLFGARDASKRDVHINAFFGVIGERESDPNDDGYREMFYVLRSVLRAQPGARFDAPTPAADLLDIRVNGAVVPNVTHAKVIDWALGASAPSGVSAPALRQAILDRWKTRAVNLTVPMTLTVGGQSRPLDVHLHAYYGDEGSAYSSAARQRYVDAWRTADVFIYSGHSHLGAGPLDPANYRAGDFPNRYQIMMVNSCVSFNYYNRDFYPLHPGGSAKLDMVVNGVEALGDNGWAVSNLITGLLSGRQQSWISLLRGMVATVPEIGLDQYDPLRVVDGETDNVYTPARLPLALAPRN